MLFGCNFSRQLSPVNNKYHDYCDDKLLIREYLCWRPRTGLKHKAKYEKCGSAISHLEYYFRREFQVQKCFLEYLRGRSTEIIQCKWEKSDTIYFQVEYFAQNIVFYSELRWNSIVKCSKADGITNIIWLLHCLGGILFVGMQMTHKFLYILKPFAYLLNGIFIWIDKRHWVLWYAHNVVYRPFNKSNGFVVC